MSKTANHTESEMTLTHQADRPTVDWSEAAVLRISATLQRIIEREGIVLSGESETRRDGVSTHTPTPDTPAPLRKAV